MRVLLIIILSGICMCQALAYQGAREQIEFLEEYIHENNMPVPMYPEVK